MKRAFTLIELSIVLIIIGLLVGGVLAGRDLIEQAKIRGISSEFQEIQLAANTYKLKYGGAAGDHDEATLFFVGTADGDGDNAVDSIPASNERWLIWQHLALAGLIAGEYTGATEAGTDFNAEVNINVPESDYQDGVGWMLFNSNGSSQTAGRQDVMLWGSDASTNHSTALGALSLEQTILFDSKFDDGIAATGSIGTVNASASFNTTGCTTGTAPNYIYGTDMDSLCNLIFDYEL